MPLSTEHVTASGGLNHYFGDDSIDGYPIGPVKLVQNQTFFYDPHAGGTQSLFFAAQAASYTSGVGAASAGALGSALRQLAWGRDGSGIPGQEVE